MDVIDTISRALASEKLRVRLPLRLIATDSAYPRTRLVDLADGRKSLLEVASRVAAPIFDRSRSALNSSHDRTEHVLDARHAAVVRRPSLRVAGSGRVSEKSLHEL